MLKMVRFWQNHPLIVHGFSSKLVHFWLDKNIQTKHIFEKSYKELLNALLSFEIHHSWLKLLALKNLM